MTVVSTAAAAAPLGLMPCCSRCCSAQAPASEKHKCACVSRLGRGACCSRSEKCVVFCISGRYCPFLHIVCAKCVAPFTDRYRPFQHICCEVLRLIGLSLVCTRYAHVRTGVHMHKHAHTLNHTHTHVHTCKHKCNNEELTPTHTHHTRTRTHTHTHAHTR